jgi:N-acetylglucosaminyldiphosphoundecaprenol N-acetyl-beta-D-mannosaminyltransferase
MIRFRSYKLEQIVKEIEEIDQDHGSFEFHLLNTFNLGLSEQDPAYKRLLQNSNPTNINLPDGWPVAFWLSILHRKLVRQIRGSDLLRFLVLNGNKNSHFFVGSTHETLTALEKSLRDLNHEAKFSGFVSPPFSDTPEFWLPEFIVSLRAQKVDFLWVGLGTPKQDYIVRAIAESNLEIKAVFAIGAAFDFVAGVKKEVPSFMRKLGLEWLHRLLSEPKRLWRRYTVFQLYFIKAILKSSFR